MIYTSLAVLAMSASAAISPVPMHRVAQVNHRINVLVYNNASSDRRFAVEGKTYTVRPFQELSIQALPGTQITAASAMPFHKAGDVVLELTPKLDHQKININ